MSGHTRNGEVQGELPRFNRGSWKMLKARSDPLSVDVPIHLYSLYSHPYAGFTSKYARREEVLAYWVRRCSTAFQPPFRHKLTRMLLPRRNASLRPTESKTMSFSRLNSSRRAGITILSNITSGSAILQQARPSR